MTGFFGWVEFTNEPPFESPTSVKGPDCSCSGCSEHLDSWRVLVQPDAINNESILNIPVTGLPRRLRARNMRVRPGVFGSK